MSKLSAAAIAVLSALAITPVTAPMAQSTQPPSTYEPTPETSCADPLGYLRRVYERELDGVSDPGRVWVRPICDGEEVGSLRHAGNAGALRARIADNDAMMQALDRTNFLPEDVVGVKMTGEDSLILFVHKFLH